MNKYILEYRFIIDGNVEEWQQQATFEDADLARAAYLEHIAEYNHAQCRVRRVRQVFEESVVAEYQLLDAEDWS